jgi:serine/threonine protein kinase/formylglycine-generating enzyme required for sulfatase activity
MPARQVEGAALLVAGHGAPGVGAIDASAVHTLGQIGEALLATGSQWHIRRLTATLGDRYAADRKTIKRSLAALVDDPVRVAVVVLLGEIVELGGELALVTGAEAHEYPEDATLPLSWIRERLAHAKAEHVVIAMSACGRGSPEHWLRELGTQREHHLVAIDSPANGNPMIDAMLAGLCGDALDPQTGTVTMASLSKHLAAHARAVQASQVAETVAQPPPLAGLWDVRHSQLANRPRPQRAPGEPEDLTGTVLPGRFRLDKLVARGTFGTVYRARQLAVERDIAVKVLHADIDPSSEDGKLFVHEIRSVGRIDHAHVVRIYQADITHDGRLFFAMELLDGEDLQSLGTAGKLSISKDRVIDLIRQLLAGLGAAHEAGLFHADIKPANAIVIPPRETADPTATTKHERAVLVDFGLARLRRPDLPSEAAESAGGTPAYMAPEQLHHGRVDARSDLFSLALVLVWLLTGWRRTNAATLVPPVGDLIEDPHLRTVLTRALDPDPAKRYQTARDLSAALAGTAAPPPPQISQEIPPVRPFRRLSPLTEADHGRLHGREDDVAAITEHALYRRCVVYAAPSGTGKTSVLRAGLMPRLEALGIHAIYIGCRTDFTWSVVKAIAPGATSIADAITRFHEQRGGKLVLVIDQVEAALGDPEFVPSLLGFDRWPAGADVSVVLAIREDWLARLLARTQAIEPNLPIVRLPPLSSDGARTAINAPLAEHRLHIEAELVDLLLADLERAAGLIGQEMGWGTTPAVFPPHLQLACSVLYEEAIERGAPQLTVALYRELGGFDAIVGEHLDRVIENELAEGQDVIARDLFVELVTSANQRAVRPESELVSIVGPKHGAANVKLVLEALRSHGLLVSVRGEGEPSWELVHDSLIPRVLAWVDKKDLARRRAIELVRHHLRQSTREVPSLLSRKELREVRSHKGAVEELDGEWVKREAPDIGWTPSTLVARSRQVVRRAVAMIAAGVITALLVGGFGFYRSSVEAARRQEMERLRSIDLGRFVLALESFDWNPMTLDAAPVSPVPSLLSWQLHVPDPVDADQPGSAFDRTWIVRHGPAVDAGAVVEQVEARGGSAFLVVSRTGCSSSIVPVRLPGYAQRGDQEPVLRIRVPTCRASHADMLEIPAGRFIHGGLGEPPSAFLKQHPDANLLEKRIDLPAFAIDRTEVTNAAFKVLASMSKVTGIVAPHISKTETFERAGLPRKPVSGLSWSVARAYCRFMGKELPTTQQWTKAMRGGERIGELVNPVPRRNLPWGHASVVAAAIAFDGRETPDAGSHPADVSPYGVLDLAGSLTEWTSTSVLDDPASHVVRGGNYGQTTTAELVDFMALENHRVSNQGFLVGMRCVSR